MSRPRDEGVRDRVVSAYESTGRGDTLEDVANLAGVSKGHLSRWRSILITEGRLDPAATRRRRPMSSAAKKICWFTNTYRTEHGSLPQQSLIARELGTSRQAVHQVIKSLKSVGLYPPEQNDPGVPAVLQENKA